MNVALQPLTIICTDSSKLKQAQDCAIRLGKTLLTSRPEALSSGYVLLFSIEKVSLRCVEPKTHGEIYVDFVAGELAHRRRFGGGKGQMIAKAMGIKGSVRPKILDATAGLGKDAFVCASLGCDVWLYERSPLAFTLLQDGLQRGLKKASESDKELLSILQRMHLTFGDSRHVSLESSENICPDVVYLDPMFPVSNTSALVNKGMQAFQALIGCDDDEDKMLDWALQCAQCRVVVKRSRRAPAILGPKPSYTLEGKSSRYDIYALKAMNP